MEVKRICAAYWSATGNTDKTVNTIAETLAEKLGVPLERRNFTRPSDRAEDLSFTGEIWWCSVCPPMRESCPTRCCPMSSSRSTGTAPWRWGWWSPSATGPYDNSLAELCAALEADGFHTVAGGAFACRHAFTDALADGRPDWDDKRQMGEFAARIADKVKDLTDIPAPVAVPGDAAAALLRAQGHGRPARQVPEGQSPRRIWASVPTAAPAPACVPWGPSIPPTWRRCPAPASSASGASASARSTPSTLMTRPFCPTWPCWSRTSQNPRRMRCICEGGGFLAFLMAVTANWVSLIYAFGPVSWLLTTILLRGSLSILICGPLRRAVRLQSGSGI